MKSTIVKFLTILIMVFLVSNGTFAGEIISPVRYRLAFSNHNKINLLRGKAPANPTSQIQNPADKPFLMDQGSATEGKPEAPSLARSDKSQRQIKALIKRYSQVHGVSERLVRAVVRRESGFNPGAVSPKGAMGLMQLMPETATLMGTNDPFDIKDNLAGGVKFLKKCLIRFNHNVALALAAYNAGPDNVIKYQGCPPFPETQAYVAGIMTECFGRTWREKAKLSFTDSAITHKEVSQERDFSLVWKIPKPQCQVSAPAWHTSTPQWKSALSPSRPSKAQRDQDSQIAAKIAAKKAILQAKHIRGSPRVYLP
jgi:hypothetical protein